MRRGPQQPPQLPTVRMRPSEPYRQPSPVQRVQATLCTIHMRTCAHATSILASSPHLPPSPPPTGLRTKAVRLLAGKAALLARVDAYGQDPSGSEGQKMLGEVQAKIDKWQEPPPAKQIKPLPKPDAEIKKRRWVVGLAVVGRQQGVLRYAEEALLHGLPCRLVTYPCDGRARGPWGAVPVACLRWHASTCKQQRWPGFDLQCAPMC